MNTVNDEKHAERSVDIFFSSLQIDLNIIGLLMTSECVYCEVAKIKNTSKVTKETWNSEIRKKSLGYNCSITV